MVREINKSFRDGPHCVEPNKVSGSRAVEVN